MTQRTPHHSQPETLHIATDRVACDGGGGVIGHPKVYLPLYDEKGVTECPYCDRVYIRENGPHSAAH